MSWFRIQSALLQADDSNLLVEFQMMNASRTHLKALMWTRYVAGQPRYR